MSFWRSVVKGRKKKQKIRACGRCENCVGNGGSTRVVNMS